MLDAAVQSAVDEYMRARPGAEPFLDNPIQLMLDADIAPQSAERRLVAQKRPRVQQPRYVPPVLGDEEPEDDNGDVPPDVAPPVDDDEQYVRPGPMMHVPRPVQQRRPRQASPAPVPLPIVQPRLRMVAPMMAVRDVELENYNPPLPVARIVQPRLPHPAVVNRGNRQLPINTRATNWVFVAWIRRGFHAEPPGTRIVRGVRQNVEQVDYITEQIELGNGRDDDDDDNEPKLHWQGYVEMDEQMRMDQMAAILGLRPGHYWAAPCFAKDKMLAINYTKKDDTAVLDAHGHKTEWRSGEMSAFSASGVWGAVHDVIRNGGDLMDVMERFPGVAIRCSSGVMRGLALYNKPQSRPNHKNILLWGPPYTSKTYTAERMFGEDNTFVRGTHKEWWDGYDGHNVVVLDEMAPNKYPIADFLRWTRGNKVSYEVRGASVPAQNNWTIVTSNIPVERWYPNACAEHQAALLERFPPSCRFYMTKRYVPPDESTMEILD